MTMLLRKTPDTVGGYKVPTDFRTWMRFGRIWEADLLTEEKIRLTFRLLRKIEPFEQKVDIEPFLRACVEFYRGGEEERPSKPCAERLIDWERDSAAIWGDFYVYVGIDLDKEKMHWWRFLAAFQSLPDESRMKQTISLRALNLSEIKDQDMRRKYAEAKAQVALDYNDDWGD